LLFKFEPDLDPIPEKLIEHGACFLFVGFD